MEATMKVAVGPKGQGETDRIQVESLSEMTGFPVDFIKKELLLKEDELSMEELRNSMASYLENTIQEIS